MEDILKARNFRVNLENSSTKMLPSLLQNMHILQYIQFLKSCSSPSSEAYFDTYCRFFSHKKHSCSFKISIKISQEQSS